MMIQWWPMGAALLHIFEEFVFPGGFAAWDRAYRPAIRSSITPGFHLFVNGVLIAVCAVVGLRGPTPGGVAAWLTVAALLASNAVFHLVGAIRTRGYSPGLVTALTLYLPMVLYGYAHFLRSGLASPSTAIVALALGASYPVWATAVHVGRARRRRT
jgi:hypothetical protein